MSALWTGVKVVVFTAALAFMAGCFDCGPWLAGDNEELVAGVQCERPFSLRAAPGSVAATEHARDQ